MIDAHVSKGLVAEHWMKHDEESSRGCFMCIGKGVPQQNFVCLSLNKIVDHKDPLTYQHKNVAGETGRLLRVPDDNDSM